MVAFQKGRKYMESETVRELKPEELDAVSGGRGASVTNFFTPDGIHITDNRNAARPSNMDISKLNPAGKASLLIIA
jgi:hypothetical protein